MKTIERLREYRPSAGPWAYEPIYWALRMAEKGTDNAHVPDDLPKDAKYPCRDDAMYIAEACNALPALLAVAEAQQREIEAWREMHASEGSTEDHSWGQLEKVNKCEEATDAAIREMEWGAE